MRDFTREDWYTWGGADYFDNGNQPMIGEVELDTNYTATIIAGGFGVTLVVTNDEDYHTEYYMDMIHSTEYQIKAIAEKMEKILSETKVWYEEYSTIHNYITNIFPDLILGF